MWRLAPVAVALGSLALGLVGAGNRSLSTDEAVALGQAEGSFGSVLSRLVHDDPAQTGGVLLVKLGAAFGHDERSLRVPSAVAVALAAGLIVALGTMLLGRVAGVVTGVALALNAGVVEASREMRPYAGGIARRRPRDAALQVGPPARRHFRWTFYVIAAAAPPAGAPSRSLRSGGPRGDDDRASRPAGSARAPASRSSSGRWSPASCSPGWPQTGSATPTARERSVSSSSDAVSAVQPAGARFS